MFFVLYLLWIIFNGKVTFEILWLGVLICGAIYLLCWKFFDYDPKKDIKYVKKIGLILEYIGVLVAEIFKANFVVVKLVLSGRKVSPVLAVFKTDLKSEAAKVVLSHSITLTPGTITVEVKDNTFVVHCLDKPMAEGMESSGFIRLLHKIED